MREHGGVGNDKCKYRVLALVQKNDISQTREDRPPQLLDLSKRGLDWIASWILLSRLPFAEHTSIRTLSCAPPDTHFAPVR